MVNKLNQQLNLEFFSANLYLQMSAWCNHKGLKGANLFFKKQSMAEMNHMYRMFDYLNDMSMMPVVGSIEAPSVCFLSLTELITHAYEHEQTITYKINNLVHSAITLQDYSTFHFLQWYIAEQREEEQIFKSIIDKLTIVNVDTNGLFLIDQDLKNMSNVNIIDH